MPALADWLDALRHKLVHTSDPALSPVPVGFIGPFWGATAPNGWLFCDGSAIPSRYTALIALVGSNTPNLKGKVIVGLDGAQTEFDTLGETGGSKTSTAPHTHDLVNHTHDLANHTHGLSSHTHTGTSGAESTTHIHQLAWRPAENTNAADVQGWPANNGHTSLRTSDHAEWGGFTLRFTDGQDQTHAHTTTTGAPSNNTSATPSSNASSAPSSNTSGVSSAAATSGNLQPYAAVPYIIKAI